MVTRRKQRKYRRCTKKARHPYSQSGGDRSIVGEIDPLAKAWLTQVKDRFDELKRDDETEKGKEQMRSERGESIPKKIENISSYYSIPFDNSEVTGAEYLLGKNDLRNWAVNLANTLNYTPQRYTTSDFYRNLSNRPIEFNVLTLPAYIELENTIRKSFGDQNKYPEISAGTFGDPTLQPFFILAIMASVDKNRLHVPIVRA